MMADENGCDELSAARENRGRVASEADTVGRDH